MTKLLHKSKHLYQCLYTMPVFSVCYVEKFWDVKIAMQNVKTKLFTDIYDRTYSDLTSMFGM